MYTADESVGAVSVCVNLTQPEIDIDETVDVFVIGNSSSFNISAGATLASKPNYAAVLYKMLPSLPPSSRSS